MYLIEILHQTTTFDFRPRFSPGCILSKFYIKPQLPNDELLPRFRCILSKFYIKPQPLSMFLSTCSRCILSKFYIKPQQPKQSQHRTVSCILSKFYIKPQLRHKAAVFPIVVSYRNSTSNHNNARRQWRFQQLYLIEILHQTTTRHAQSWRQKSCILSKFYIKPQRRASY